MSEPQGSVTVHLLKPGKGATVSYKGKRLLAEPEHVLIHARWERATLELGYVTFDLGDHFFEHYYAARWYNIFEVRSAAGVLKGWYCNVTRPARFEGDRITSEDLELDLFVSPDQVQLLTLDVDEFEARALQTEDPAAYRAALTALDELKRRARAALPPFNSTHALLSLGVEALS